MVEPVLGIGDPIAALIEWLALDASIDEVLDEDATRIVGKRLPLSHASLMPRACLVVAAAGGFAEGLPEVVDRVRVDVRAYGRTDDEAMRLAVLVRLRMKALRRYVSTLGTVLLSPTRTGGYIPLNEQAGGWPLVLRSYLLPFDERVVAA